MNILITGAKGFLGRNLSLSLTAKNHTVMEFDVDVSKDTLFSYIEKADFIVHLAGINRPLTKEEFYQGNTNFTVELIEMMKKAKKVCPLIFSSSIQATLENDYGRSKKMAEDYLFSFQKECGNKVFIYRLSNLYGKWSRPNYNSVVATFCYNIAHNLPIQISNPQNEIPLVYIDDVVDEFVAVIENTKSLDSNQLHEVKPIDRVTVGHLADLILSFKESRTNLLVPDLKDAFVSKLYATYLSYLDTKNFSYELNMKQDPRGSFTEFLRTEHHGQVSVNVAKPGITKGNHYHHTKNEKFLVVSGQAEIKFRKVGEQEIISYKVSGEKLVVVDIPPGYTHNITNVGQEDLVTIMWVSEVFDPNDPDTFFLKV